MKGRGKKRLHQTPPEFARSAEYKDAIERQIQKLAAPLREEARRRLLLNIQPAYPAMRPRGKLVEIDMFGARIYESDLPASYLAERKAKMLPRHRKRGII